MRFLQNKKTLLVTLGLIALAGSASSVFAQDTVSEGFNVAQNIGGGAFGTTDIREVIVNIVNIALGFLGIVAVIILIYGGWLWMTAAGNPDRVESAKRTIRNAVIGLAIIIASWAIVLFVVTQLFGATGGGPGGQQCTTPGATQGCGPALCGVQICQADNTWGACDTSACPGGSGGSNLAITGRYPLGTVNPNVCLNTIIFASFNRPIADASIAGNFTVRACTDATCAAYSGTVPGTATSLDINGVESRSVVFTPSAVLAAGTTYEVEVLSDAFTSTGISSNDVTPLYLPGNDVWTFISGTTIDTTPPQVQPPTIPFDGEANVCLETFLSAEFNEVMNPLTLTGSAITVGSSSGGTIPTYQVSGQYLNTSPLVPSPHHAIIADRPNPIHGANETYDVTVANTVMDACGNAMAAPYGGTGAWQFDTGATVECLPRITGISSSPYYEDTVTISGAYLQSPTSITFGNNANPFSNTCLQPAAPFLANSTCNVLSSPISITTTLPSGPQANTGAQDGIVSVTTPAGSVNSALPHDVAAPFIRAISTGRTVSGLPAASADQFMTIIGNDFGTTPGQVWFTHVPSGTRVQAALACSAAAGWQDSFVIVTPTPAMNVHIDAAWEIQVEIVVGGITHRSNLGQIWFDTVAAGPGLCSFRPPTATPNPSGTPFDLVGENFESMSPIDGNEIVRFGVPGNAIDALGNSPTINLNFSGTQDEALGLAVPTIRPQNNVGVFITDGNVTSNSLLFDVTPGVGAGPIILDFTPQAGGTGQYVTITGTGFGNTQGNVHFYTTAVGNSRGYDVPTATLGDFVSFPLVCQGNLWNDSQIIVKVPPGFSGNYYVAVEDINAVAGNTENLATPQFNQNGAPPTPGICLVNPPNGVVGSTIDIHGDNFGGAIDQVLFHSSGGPVPAAAIGAWSNQQITGAAVPVGAETGPLVVDVGGIQSNPYDFTIGLCTAAVDPATACSAGYSCCDSGDFTGQCRLDLPGGFSSCNIQQQTSLQSWTFSTGVGPGSSCQTALDINGDPLPVPPNICVPDSVRCNSSSLVCEQSTCTCQPFIVVVSHGCSSLPQSPSPADGYQEACVNSEINVRFNDSVDITTINNIIVESCTDSTCASRTPISPATLTYRSDTGAVTNDSVRIFPTNPATLLTPDTWYMVTVPVSVVSQSGGIALAQPFTWTFKTKNSAAPCQPNQCQLTPPSSTVANIGAASQYTLSANAAGCNLIYGSYPFDLTSSDTAIATINPTVAPTVSFSPIDVTAQSQGSVTIRATNQTDPALFCTAGFTVNTQIPQVNLRRPDCTTACINATVGATFSTEVNVTDLIANTTIVLRQCPGGPGTCSQTDPTVTLDGATMQFDGVGDPALTNKFDVGILGLLSQGATYLVTLDAQNIFSPSGEPLVSNDPTGTLYTWEFTTKTQGNGLCIVDHIIIEPASKTVTTIGQAHEFTGVAYGPPDECNPTSGQRLNPIHYSWTDTTGPLFGWDAPTPLVADIVRTGSGPGGLFDREPDGLVDSVQEALTIGTDLTCAGASCSTQIQGAIDPGPSEPPISCTDGGANACANLTLVCGHPSDDACSQLNSGDPQIGVATNTCCGPRPQVLNPPGPLPADGATGVCRNIAIQVPFDTELDPNSLTGNVFLAREPISGICNPGENSLLVRGVGENQIVHTIPTGRFERFVEAVKDFFKGLFGSDAQAQYVPGTNLCIVPATVGLDPLGTTILIGPNDPLNGLEQHFIVILGDDDILDGQKVGLRSKIGVTMNGPVSFIKGSTTFNSYVFGFTTRQTICPIDHIDHTWLKNDPTLPGWSSHSRRDERFFCANDMCIDDVGGTFFSSLLPGNQHVLFIEPRSVEGWPLGGDIQFSKAGPDFFDLCVYPFLVTGPCSFSNLSTTLPTSLGVSEVIVSGTKPGFSTDARGTVTAVVQNPSDPSNRIAKTLNVHLFDCANPWPDINNFPFNDQAGNCIGGGSCPDTNFDFYYCRDAGQPGTHDDLPALEIIRPVVTGGTTDFICYGGSNPGIACTPATAATDCACSAGDPGCSSVGLCQPAGLKDLVFPRELGPGAITNFSVLPDPFAQLGGGLAVASFAGPAPGGSTGYKLYWGFSSGNYPFSLNLGNNPFVTIPNLDPNRDYYLNMTTYRLTGAGQESSFDPSIEVGPVRPDDTVSPAVPINISVTPGPGRLQIDWQDDPATASDVAKYELAIGTQSGVYLQTVDVGNVNSHTLSLSPGTTYFIQITVFDAAGNSNSAAEASGTTL